MSYPDGCKQVFHEVKARKAAFGFKYSVRGNVQELIALGFILSEIERCWPERIYIETGNGAGVVSVNAYTDYADAANWFRTSFIE